MTDMFAPVSNSAVVACCWTVLGYVALMPSTEASLMMTASSVASQSELGNIKLNYWLKRFNKASPLVVSSDGFTMSIVMNQSDGLHNFIYCDLLLGNIRQGV